MSAAHPPGMNQNRTPAGVPTGGQFSEQAKGEAADVDLGSEPVDFIPEDASPEDVGWPSADTSHGCALSEEEAWGILRQASVSGGGDYTEFSMPDGGKLTVTHTTDFDHNEYGGIEGRKGTYTIRRNDELVDEVSYSRTGMTGPDATWRVAALVSEQSHQVDEGFIETHDREMAEDAIRAYEGFLQGGLSGVGQGSLVTAAEALEKHLPPLRQKTLRDAREAYQQAQASAVTSPGAANVLHAELVDALDEAPSRAEVLELEEQVRAAKDLVSEKAVARDIGQGTEHGVSVARHDKVHAEQSLAQAREARHAATRMRVAQGRPTVYDMWETQERRDEAFYARREAVNKADAARSSYRRASPDSVDQQELATRAREVDEATRREGAARDAFDVAEIELANASNAWGQMRGEVR